MSTSTMMPVAAPTKVPQRKDARRNRETLLSAARDLFAESGEVPMYEIARRAGVGQATLYRHFPDRGAVASAIFAEELDGLERLAAENAGDPNAFFVLLRAVVQLQVQFHGLVGCVQGEPGMDSDTEHLKERFIELLRQPLRDAKAAGTLRSDLGIDDVFLLIAMVAGALDMQDNPAASAAASARVLTLLVDGLGSPRSTI
jgi:AcrR family transcriptional regulator